MKPHFLKWPFSMVITVFLFNSPAHAQYPGAIRPAVSPYLNLLRGNSSSLTLNYWNLVQPQMQLYAAAGQAQQQLGGLQQQYSGLEQQYTAGIQPTGHQFGFMTQSRYFMNLGSGGGSAMGNPASGGGGGTAMGNLGRGGIGGRR